MSQIEARLESPARCAGNEIVRRRVAAWLGANERVPVRILCAPTGTGKTVAARQYVAQRNGATRYLRVPAGADATLLRRLIDASDAEEVVLDDVDRATAHACRALLDAIEDNELPQRLILVARSQRRLQTHAFVASRRAAVCDASALAFDAAELGELAASYGIGHGEHDVAQLLYDTEGWALAAHWLMRDAVERGRSLRDAFMTWRERNGHLLVELLENERYEDADAFDTFRRLLVEGWSDAQHELERLEHLGLPIVRARVGLRPYRILARLAAPRESETTEHHAPATPLMLLNVLGRFRCEIAGQPVTFARRRDRQLFVFVALAPDGRTSRDRLLEAFWPGVDRATACQSLRPALNRIRRAIHDAAPSVDPDRYFRTAGEVAIDTRTVAVDVRRFIDRVEQGRLDDARSSVDGAKHHYRAAHRVYADRLLAAEGAEPCLERRVDELETLYVEVLTRLTELCAATGELETARGYADELLTRNNDEVRRREGALGASA